METNKHQNLLHKELSCQIQGAAIEVCKNFGPGLKIFFVSLGLIFVLFSVLPITAEAAQVLWKAENSTIKTGDRFQVDIFLDAQSESLNALKGELVWPGDILSVKEIKEGNSVMSLWIRRPQAANGVISFSGLIPGGYIASDGFIFSVIFEAQKAGSGSLSLRDLQVLLNDGKGTGAAVYSRPFAFNIAAETPHVPLPIMPDDFTGPEPFTPQIASSTAIFGGKWFLAFAAEDKESGIDYYEVFESRSEGVGAWAHFVAAESPHLLSDQSLKSYIYVRAVSKGGGERVVELMPRYDRRWYENRQLFIILIIGLIMVYLAGRWRKKII